VPNCSHAHIYLPLSDGARSALRIPSSIVVDNASTDKGLDVLDALRTEVGALRIVRMKTLAITAPNRTLKEVRGFRSIQRVELRQVERKSHVGPSPGTRPIGPNKLNLVRGQVSKQKGVVQC
jgi:hypothetical protein